MPIREAHGVVRAARLAEESLKSMSISCSAQISKDTEERTTPRAALASGESPSVMAFSDPLSVPEQLTLVAVA